MKREAHIHCSGCGFWTLNGRTEKEVVNCSHMCNFVVFIGSFLSYYMEKQMNQINRMNNKFTLRVAAESGTAWIVSKNTLGEIIWIWTKFMKNIKKLTGDTVLTSAVALADNKENKSNNKNTFFILPVAVVINIFCWILKKKSPFRELASHQNWEQYRRKIHALKMKGESNLQKVYVTLLN